MFPDLTRDDVFRIETRRLWLRWPRARDVDTIVRLAGERAVAEMTARIPHPIERAGIDAFVLDARRGNAAGEGLVMALSLRSDPAGLVGVIGIEAEAAADGPHLGYWLGHPFWGRGLATEAATAIVDAYFAYAGGAVLTSNARVENAASGRVLEKAGFGRTGSGTGIFPARGGAVAFDRFRLDRAAWSARRADAVTGGRDRAA
ncbi:GNAT family N-acetyltransferase [uncultured Methylobacterium sp.]|uniref:GNAT family N-acetyltransferase n=1 Tax=uncultured Methylobacterium sp. TaxID=157278 RepID=UPI0035CC87D0